jgi:hypothetical protein
LLAFALLVGDVWISGSDSSLSSSKTFLESLFLEEDCFWCVAVSESVQTTDEERLEDLFEEG